MIIGRKCKPKTQSTHGMEYLQIKTWRQHLNRHYVFIAHIIMLSTNGTITLHREINYIPSCLFKITLQLKNVLNKC
jgi:hypothetical protein